MGNMMGADDMKQRIKDRFERLRQGEGAQKARGWGLGLDGWLDGLGHWAWIALMVVTLIFLPPLGLLVVIWMIWGKEFFGPAPFWRQARHADKDAANPATNPHAAPVIGQPTRPRRARAAATETDPAGNFDQSLLHVSSLLGTADSLRRTEDPDERARLLLEGRLKLENALDSWPEA